MQAKTHRCVNTYHIYLAHYIHISIAVDTHKTWARVHSARSHNRVQLRRTPIIPEGVDFSDCKLSSLGDASEHRNFCVLTDCGPGYRTVDGANLRGLVECTGIEGKLLEYTGNITCEIEDICATLDASQLAAAVDPPLPPHVDTADCQLSLSSQECTLSGCELGFLSNSGGTG